MKTQFKISEHTYRLQGIKGSIKSAERKAQETSDKTKEEILLNSDKNTRLLEDACSAIISVIGVLKDN